MKRIIIFIALCFATYNISSQTWVDLLMEGGKFEETQRLFEAEWNQKTPQKGKGFKQFKRWEEFAGHRLGDDGYVNTPALWEAFKSQQNLKNNASRNQSHWQLVGPAQTPEGGGNGRLNCIAFHPNDSNIFYVGAPAGGIWKTVNGGQSWTTTTDFLACIGISDIVINPLNPNTMYMATGDKNGGDTYSLGVMKSYDAGETWFPTNLEFTAPLTRRVSRLLINPNDTSILLAATNYGIYKTIDAGENWVRTRVGSFKDMAFKPNNPNIIYASTAKSIQRSTDGGEYFTTLTLPLIPYEPSRIAIAVTPADSNYVYLLIGNGYDQGFGGLALSTDGGDSFQAQADSPNILGWETDGSDSGGQAWYDLSIAAHPNLSKIVFTGGVNIWRSFNYGSNWVINAHWYGGGGKPYVHADIHELKYAPNSNRLYACTDGGLFMTQNNGQTWNDLSTNLVIGQIYRMDHSTQNADIVLTGWQDNGTNLGVGSNWRSVLGGDGMDCAIDYSNDQTMYASYYYGAFFRSNDGGYIWDNISNNIPEEGAWITPMAIHPTTPSTLFAGYKNVFKSDNYGDSWSQISNFSQASNINILKISPSNPDNIYVGYSNAFRKTTDGGLLWETFSSPTGSNISDIAIHPENENEIWMTFSGYSEQYKVMHSEDGGTTWINLTDNLPNIPVNCIIYENNSPNGVYIGTDIGVFYRDTLINTWVNFSGGLPNTVIRDMAIHNNTGKLRVATYGRAVWETELYYIVNIKKEDIFKRTQMQIFPNPAADNIHILLNNNKIEEGTILIYDANGRIVKSENIAFNYQKCSIGVADLQDGFYILQMRTKFGIFNEKLILKKQ